MLKALLTFCTAPTPLIEAADVQGLVDQITATVTGLLPVLLGLTGIFLAIKFVPGLIRRFSK